MRQIPLGAKGSFQLLVQPEHLANRFKDATLPPVLATPVMIMVMENAALNAIRAYLDPGESAVGNPASGHDSVVPSRTQPSTEAAQHLVAQEPWHLLDPKPVTLVVYITGSLRSRSELRHYARGPMPVKK